MRFKLVLLLALLVSPAAAYYPAGRHACASSTDFGSNAWITYPAQTGCDDATKACDTSTTDRLLWTQDRIAQAGKTIVYIGGVEDDLDLPGKPPGGLYPDYRPPESSAFALNFSDGREDLSTLDLLAYMQGIEARVPAGRAQPIKTFAMRFDLLFREDLSRIGDYAPTPDWLLRTDRTLANVAASYGGGVLADTDTSRCGGDGTLCAWSPCRAPTEDSIVADEVYGAAGTTLGCGRPYDGTSTKERGARLDEILEELETGLGEAAVYYLARPNDPSNAKVFHPYAVLANMLDPGFQAAAVKRAQRAIELGYDAVDFPRKDQYFIDQVGGFDVEHWPDTADALGGYSTMAAAVAAQTIFSGPPETPAGAAFGYASRKLAEVQLARLLDAATDPAVPTVRIVNPYWYEGCDKTIDLWTTPYDDASCDGPGESDSKYDDPASASDEEDAYQREIVARADNLLISTGGKTLGGSIGSGGGSGWTYHELKAFLESLPSPDGTPPVVLGYADGAPFASSRGIPPAYCADPAEDNPESDLPVCGNGTTEAGEECDDSNTTSGDGCDKFCRLPDVFVIAGQSNAVGYSNVDVDPGATRAPRVTSTDTLTGLISSNYRYRYTDPGQSAGGDPLAVLNDFPCADSQCTGTACGIGTQNRTKAGHPDTTAATSCTGGGTCTDGVCVGGSNPGVDCDGTCSCYCGVHGSAYASWEGTSAWPTFAQRYMQDVGREVLLIDVTYPGTSLVYDGDGAGPSPLWDPNSACSGNTDYDDEQGDLACGLFRAADLAGVEDRVQAVLFVQGENDASGAVAGATYKQALKDLSDKINSMYGRTVPLLVAPLSDRSNATDSCTASANLLAIRTAQLEAISEDDDIYMGPSLDDIPLHDGGALGNDHFGNGGCVHYQDQQTHGERWYEAVRSLLTDQAYDGGAAVIPPASSLVAAFTATPIQGTTCVAPCAVHFDAIGDGTSETTDGDYSREFHTHGFRWDFGDPGSGTWGRGANPTASRNAGEGAIQGHLYETPGTYTATLTVTAPDGETDTVSHSITVTNPDTQFSGTSTICVGNSLPTAGVGGCPAGAAVVSNSDLDDALSDTTTGDGGGVNGGCNADGAKVRCLFKGGDTFTASQNVNLYSGSSGPGMIGSYGTGLALMRSNNAGGNAANTITLAPGWKIARVDMENRNTGDTTSPFMLPGNSTATAGVEIIGVHCWNLANYCASTAGGAGAGSPYNAALFDNSTESDSALLDADPGGFFLRHNNLLVMGNSFGGPSPDYLVRTVHSNKYLNAHNTYTNNNSTTQQNALQIRSCEISGCGGNNTVQQTRWIIVSDNFFLQRDPGSAGPTIKLWDNSANATGTGTGGIRDIIVERNFQRFLPGASPVAVAGMVGYHPPFDLTVRNNVLDLQGMNPSAGSPASIVWFGQASFGFTPTGIEVYNNTAYTDDTGSGSFTACVGSANIAAGAKCYGNLVYEPNRSGANNATDGGNWTAADNVFATTMPFIAPPPQQGLTSMDDFNVNVGSQADGAGYDFSGADTWNALDAGGCVRSAPWDAGAWQIGATGCLATESLIGINSEKMLVAEEAIIFADAIDDHPVLRHTADPATSREESFFRSYRTNLSTLESGITIPTNARGWPSVDLPYDNDGGGANPAVVARMDLMSQSSGRPLAYPAGSYTLRFDGTGEVVLTGDGSVTCTGTDQSCAVSITPTTTGVSLWITSSDPGNLGDPITEVDLLLPGYTTADQFYWPSVVRLRPFGFLRSMNAIRVNDYECSNLATGAAQSALATCVHTWATRTQPTGIQASRKGIAWENQIALADAAQIDLWVNIPHAADDDYATNLADLLRSTLDGKTYMELSNEAWNPGFAQEQYFTAVGVAAGWGSGETAQRRAYVERAADFADIFDAEFTAGDAPRLVKVLGSSLIGDTSALITALGSATYNPTGATFDAIAVNPYWDGTGANVTALLDDAEANVAALETYFDSEYAAINAYGAEMFAYEGGPIIDGSDSVSIDANDDDRMEGIVEDFFTLWFANGGKATGAGFFARDALNGGALRYPTQPLDDAPKYRGYRNSSKLH